MILFGGLFLAVTWWVLAFMYFAFSSLANFTNYAAGAMVALVGVVTFGMWQRQRWALWGGRLLTALLLPLSLWALVTLLSSSFWHDFRTMQVSGGPAALAVDRLQMVAVKLILSFFPGAWLFYFSRPRIKAEFH